MPKSGTQSVSFYRSSTSNEKGNKNFPGRGHIRVFMWCPFHGGRNDYIYPRYLCGLSMVDAYIITILQERLEKVQAERRKIENIAYCKFDTKGPLTDFQRKAIGIIKAKGVSSLLDEADQLMEKAMILDEFIRRAKYL